VTVAGTMDFKPTFSFLRKEDSLARELVITVVAIVVFGGMGVLLLYSSIGFPLGQFFTEICRYLHR